jgi:hypothetical protein
MSSDSPSLDALEAKKLADLLLPFLAPKAQPSYSPPACSVPSHVHQVRFNATLVHMLEPVVSLSPSIQEAVESLKERNSLLHLSESNPGLLSAAETAKALAGKGNDPLSMALLLSSVANSNGSGKKRKIDQQPFRARGAGVPVQAPQYIPQPVFYQQPVPVPAPSFQQFPSPIGGFPARQRSTPICYSCNQSGHVRSQCPLGVRR